jgi:hypothetical protein
MDQHFGGGWNFKDENRFNAIGKQLNLLEGQKTRGQRHDYPPMHVRSGDLVQDTGAHRCPKAH